MAINLVTKYLPYVDELFYSESKTSLVTNKDFEFTGAKTVKVYKISTAEMNDYIRSRADLPSGQLSHYGEIADLDAITEEMTLTKDRSFTFTIDYLDEQQTGEALEPATALARQLREVVIPEVDAYVYAKMCTNAGTKLEAKALDADNIYEQIAVASEALDDAEAPESSRVLVVSPKTLMYMKLNKNITFNSDIGAELRKKGVISELDGMQVVKVASKKMPADFGFMIAHNVATVAPVVLADYIIHPQPQFISGSLIEGRIAYDAFVLDNKAKAIAYQPIDTGA